MEMKSKIRSRWYRANEKPLESRSSGSATNQSPFGEVLITSREALKDDLNDESAKKASNNRPARDTDSNRERKHSRHERKPSRRSGEKDGRSSNNNKRRENRNRAEPKDNSVDGTRGHHKPKQPAIRSKPKPTKPRQSGASKKPSHSKNETVQKPKSGVSKFLSKLFGS